MDMDMDTDTDTDTDSSSSSGHQSVQPSQGPSPPDSVEAGVDVGEWMEENLDTLDDHVAEQAFAPYIHQPQTQNTSYPWSQNQAYTPQALRSDNCQNVTPMQPFPGGMGNNQNSLSATIPQFGQLSQDENRSLPPSYPSAMMPYEPSVSTAQVTAANYSTQFDHEMVQPREGAERSQHNNPNTLSTERPQVANNPRPDWGAYAGQVIPIQRPQVQNTPRPDWGAYAGQVIPIQRPQVQNTPRPDWGAYAGQVFPIQRPQVQNTPRPDWGAYAGHFLPIQRSQMQNTLRLGLPSQVHAQQLPCPGYEQNNTPMQPFQMGNTSVQPLETYTRQAVPSGYDENNTSVQHDPMGNTSDSCITRKIDPIQLQPSGYAPNNPSMQQHPAVNTQNLSFPIQVLAQATPSVHDQNNTCLHQVQMENNPSASLPSQEQAPETPPSDYVQHNAHVQHPEMEIDQNTPLAEPGEGPPSLIPRRENNTIGGFPTENESIPLPNPQISRPLDQNDGNRYTIKKLRAIHDEYHKLKSKGCDMNNMDKELLAGYKWMTEKLNSMLNLFAGQIMNLSPEVNYPEASNTEERTQDSLSKGLPRNQDMPVTPNGGIITAPRPNSWENIPQQRMELQDQPKPVRSGQSSKGRLHIKIVGHVGIPGSIVASKRSEIDSPVGGWKSVVIGRSNARSNKLYPSRPLRPPSVALRKSGIPATIQIQIRDIDYQDWVKEEARRQGHRNINKWKNEKRLVECWMSTNIPLDNWESGLDCPTETSPCRMCVERRRRGAEWACFYFKRSIACIMLFVEGGEEGERGKERMAEEETGESEEDSEDEGKEEPTIVEQTERSRAGTEESKEAKRQKTKREPAVVRRGSMAHYSQLVAHGRCSSKLEA